MNSLRILLVMAGTLGWAAPAAAQGDYHRFEFSGGYSLQSTDGALGEGDVYSSDPNAPLAATLPVFGPVTGAGALTPTTPGGFSGDRHRALQRTPAVQFIPLRPAAG